MEIDKERRPERQERGPETPPAARVNLDRLFLYRRGELSWDQMTGFRSGPRRHGRKLMFWSWMALTIDGLILISASSFFLMIFALIMKSPLREFLQNGSQIGLPKLFLLSFVVFSWLYMVTTRVLSGFSIGEGACDLRLGQPTQRLRSSYPFKVMLRATLILATGFIVLPALSLLLGRDLPGRLSGLPLISLK